ncbi:MAG: hybrid sensor histidine kinase/response regulator [Anaerolineae bacterium]|nr:hybrid sensor histidine kinase/response regulator [Anaerolineae bacterium]
MGKKRILVVEDHDLLLYAIRDILDAEGYEVVTATDGIDALGKMGDATPDLIIADISMPRMDGYRFFEEVHAHPEWVPIPFIFLTARAEREDRLRGKAMGAEDYIVKPFDPQELVIVVNSRIGRAEAIREATETEFEDLKQQIITLLSHELRTPLTSVYGYTELALEEATGLPPGDFQQFLVGIKRGADRLTQLVEDLLMVVRLDTGELQREFDLLSTVQDNLSEMIVRTAKVEAVKAATQSVQLELDVPPDLPPVLIHEFFLSDALSRVIDNAVKFSRKNERRVLIRAFAADDHVSIVVQDWGVGIPQDQIDRLFERFGQINRKEMEQQGTGLGLVIVKALSECMNGHVLIESSQREPSGTTVTIQLPVAHPPS